jgi:hypothetical protein
VFQGLNLEKNDQIRYNTKIFTHTHMVFGKLFGGKGGETPAENPRQPEAQAEKPQAVVEKVKELMRSELPQRSGQKEWKPIETLIAAALESLIA